MSRVGDRDRERVQTLLRRHFLAGRLSEAELAERIGAALAARSRGELRRALAELPPAWLQLDERVRPAVERARYGVRVAALFVVWLVTSIFLLLAFAGWLVAVGPGVGALLAFPFAWLVLSGLLYRRAAPARRRP
ncbi:MAG TPA: DUF1707 domain-containing protein [Gaiellaceae bacterium]|nr:DUF1707 domain-containing protein [Gaiellaceae bacterium]